MEPKQPRLAYVGAGARVRFDRLTGNTADVERAKHAPGVFLNYKGGYCETCKSVKPRDKRKKVMKGWKCADCLNGV